MIPHDHTSLNSPRSSVPVISTKTTNKWTTGKRRAGMIVTMDIDAAKNLLLLGM